MLRVTTQGESFYLSHIQTSSNHTVPRVIRSVGLKPVRVNCTWATPGGMVIWPSTCCIPVVPTMLVPIPVTVFKMFPTASRYVTFRLGADDSNCVLRETARLYVCPGVTSMGSEVHAGLRAPAGRPLPVVLPDFVPSLEFAPLVS